MQLTAAIIVNCDVVSSVGRGAIADQSTLVIPKRAASLTVASCLKVLPHRAVSLRHILRAVRRIWLAAAAVALLRVLAVLCPHYSDGGGCGTLQRHGAVDARMHRCRPYQLSKTGLEQAMRRVIKLRVLA